MNVKYSTDLIIPDWFDISIYDKCESWGIGEWEQELSSRYYMDNVFKKEKRKKLTSERLERYKNMANQRILMPLEDKNIHLNIAFSPIVDQLASDFFGGYYAVNNKRYRNWVERMHCANEFADEMAMGLDDVPESTQQKVNEYYSTPAWQVHRDARYNNSDERFFIGVDLRSSDEYLVEQFKSWINKTRCEAGISSINRKFTEKDFNKWHKNRYLPFLDLYFWALVNDKNIDYSVIEAELFPNCEFRDRVRRSISINAVKLVSDSYIYALKVQQRTYSCVSKKLS